MRTGPAADAAGPSLQARSLSQALRGFLDEAEICVGRNVHRLPDESKFAGLVHVRLQRLEVRPAIAVAVEILGGEEPVFERARRALEERSSDLRRLPVIDAVEVPAQGDDIVLQEIDERGAMACDEILAHDPERQRHGAELAA